jgi:hypothetical protein
LEFWRNTGELEEKKVIPEVLVETRRFWWRFLEESGVFYQRTLIVLIFQMRARTTKKNRKKIEE